MTKYFIIGGAGYVGSHVIKLLGETQPDAEILTYDNLSGGHKEHVLYGDFVQGDVLDYEKLNKTIKEFQPDIVMHFSALIIAPESVSKPLKYYENNVAGSLNILKAMVENKIDKLVFSSTAAVYGMPKKVPIDENAELKPINPYGHSKLMMEQVIKDTANAYGLKYVMLRYFNVAGASPDNVIGDSHKRTSHLIPLVLDTALGRRDKLFIFGTDYPTPDGTAIRDYIHVTDLADALLLVSDYLLSGGKSNIYNCGYGHGYSVREVIDVAKKVTGVDFPVEEADRRPGDPAILVADSSKLQKELGWKPKYDSLETIIQHAWNWHQKRYGMKPKKS